MFKHAVSFIKVAANDM